MKKVLVTGGSGFVGKSLKKHKEDWIFLSSKDCDLTIFESVLDTFNFYKPDAILHLAAKVGGIKFNKENQASFFDDNILINTNVIRSAHACNVDRVLCSLSTCAFPNVVDRYPFNERDLFKGPPADTNFSYGFSKRMLHVQCLSYRKQYGRNYSTFCPSNIYGPGDNFDSENSHFIAALISKVSKLYDGDVLRLWGDGNPLRQQLFIDDLIKIIPILLEKHNTSMPLIVAPNENISIYQMAKILLEKTNKKIKIEFNNKMSGQFRKDGSNENLINLIGNFQFTDFSDGVNKTFNWYLENR